MKTVSLLVNQKPVQIEADPEMPLLWVIRDIIGLTGTKFGCGMGLCGACTVHLDGQPVRSCQIQIGSIEPKQKITTIEGIAEPVDMIVQQAWIEHQVPQCGYCQSGQIMSAVALLKSNARPSDIEIDEAMAGNICRCGTYTRIRQAIHTASAQLNTKPVNKSSSGAQQIKKSAANQ